jgi:uroporphyrinogen-III decarboxylase
MLDAIDCKPTDHLPCCMMSFTAMRDKVDNNWYELAKAELGLGMDAMLFIPTATRSFRREHPDLRGFPVRFHPEVKVKVWKEDIPGNYGILHKEYHTPEGILTASVRLSDDWPHGDHFPFIDDYQIPRAVKPLVTRMEDLKPLSYLLQAPHPDDVANYMAEAAKASTFCKEQDILLAGGWGVGWDMANWLCGMQELMLLIFEQPELVKAVLGMIHEWNLQRMEVILAGKVDLFIRRAWYEGSNIVTPDFYEEAIMPLIKKEAALAHSYGVKFGYISTSGSLPMFDFYLEAGIDVVIGVDPIQTPYADMAAMKRKAGNRICLWGGVSGSNTVEIGTAEEVKNAVNDAIRVLGKTGFILCPADNLTEDTPKTWENLNIFINEWKKSIES